MGALWESAYKGIAQLIALNPCVITWNRYPFKDNGRGNPIRDTEGTPNIMRATVRIAHERSGVPQYQAGPTGLSTAFSLYVIMLPEVDLLHNDIITEVDTWKRWKVGVVDFSCSEGKIYVKRAPLIRADGGDIHE